MSGWKLPKHFNQRLLCPVQLTLHRSGRSSSHPTASASLMAWSRLHGEADAAGVACRARSRASSRRLFGVHASVAWSFPMPWSMRSATAWPVVCLDCDGTGGILAADAGGTRSGHSPARIGSEVYRDTGGDSWGLVSGRYPSLCEKLESGQGQAVAPTDQGDFAVHGAKVFSRPTPAMVRSWSHNPMAPS